MTGRRRFYSVEGERAFGRPRRLPYILMFANFAMVILMLLFVSRLKFEEARVSRLLPEGMEAVLTATETERGASSVIRVTMRNLSGRTLRMEEDRVVFVGPGGARKEVVSGRGEMLVPGEERHYEAVWPRSEAKSVSAEWGFGGRRERLAWEESR